MNKLVFLTGLLTALLFISTAHGRQFDEQAFEFEELQALMQEDEDAEAQSLINTIKTAICGVANAYCGHKSFMDNTAIIQLNIKDILEKLKGLAGKYGTKENLCILVKAICK